MIVICVVKFTFAIKILERDQKLKLKMSGCSVR